MDSDSKLNLKASFPPPSYDEWLAAVNESLKGADFDKVMKTKTEEGIVLQPIYRRADIAGLAFTDSVPGSAPYLRGNNPQRFLQEGWLIAQSHSEKDLKKLNAEILEELNLGLTSVNISLEEGLKFETLADLEAALQGVILEAAPLFVQLGIADIAFLQLLEAYAQKHGIDLANLECGVGIDITGEFAQKGSLPFSLEETWKKMLDAVKWNLEKAPKNRLISIDATVYEAAGASAVQELAFALSTAIGYIQGLQNAGFEIDKLAPMFQVKLSLGSNFFMEIAKLRAFRLIWAQMIKAFGGSEASQKVWIHGKTARFNKSIYDNYVNVLRTSTEGFAGVIGGVDSLEIDCFDRLRGESDEFSRRMARNQQVILKEEAHFGKVIDPAGGCYYIENLSNDLAEKAWTLMQEIEAAEGMVRSLRAGRIHDYLDKAAQSRIDAANKRKSVFVGVNMYANPLEKAANPSKPEPAVELPKAAILDKGPLPKRRAMEAVENLRMRIEASPAQKQIFLMTMGSVAEFKARADFANGFFQVAGFEVMYPQGFSTVNEAVDAALKSGANAICICSTDENYVQLVPEICEKLKGMTMILAGYPTDQIEAYKEYGISSFIHIRADLVSTLAELAVQMEVIA